MSVIFEDSWEQQKSLTRSNYLSKKLLKGKMEIKPTNIFPSCRLFFQLLNKFSVVHSYLTLLYTDLF